MFNFENDGHVIYMAKLHDMPPTIIDHYIVKLARPITNKCANGDGNSVVWSVVCRGDWALAFVRGLILCFLLFNFFFLVVGNCNCYYLI